MTTAEAIPLKKQLSSDTIIIYSKYSSNPSPKESAVIYQDNRALEKGQYSEYWKIVKEMESELIQNRVLWLEQGVKKRSWYRWSLL